MNDSVETLLINLIRGASLNGLGGIKPVNKKIIRPIIGVERNEIERYLSDNFIAYCVDSTNKQNIYTRNRIRNIIIEEMKNINPSVVKTVYSNLNNLRDDDDCLNQIALNSDALSVSDNTVSVDMKILHNHHIAVKKRILYKAFSLLKGDTKNIEQKHIDILLSKHSSGKTFNMPCGINVKTSYDKLTFYYSPNNSQVDFFEQVIPDCTISQNNSAKLEFKVVHSIKCFEKNVLYVDYDKLIKRNLYVRNKKDGDKFIPFGMSGKKKIKQYFIDLKIPLDERKKIPLLCADDDIVAVIPYRISEKYKVTDNTKQILRIQMIKE